ncbi:hypothetical protein LBMAG57_31020 [Verrucomicrobiota bacterium]|nr:hypothetical protein LBMAG57_31020 [Verrucomicrobiota bacterium]
MKTNPKSVHPFHVLHRCVARLKHALAIATSIPKCRNDLASVGRIRDAHPYDINYPAADLMQQHANEFVRYIRLCP